MSISTPSPPIASPLPLPLDAQASNDSKVLIEDTKSEDGKTSGRSHTDSIGESSTSSWPVEETRAASNDEDELLKHRRNSSIESKMSCTWSEDKENVGFGYPTLICMNLKLILCWKTVRKPYDYIASLGGKALRRQFLFALNGWLQVDEESCEIIDCAISMLHNSSLL